jgi:hypothetical protein
LCLGFGLLWYDGEDCLMFGIAYCSYHFMLTAIRL